MNTVSRVAPGCNFFFERERMKVLMSQGTSARLVITAVLGRTFKTYSRVQKSWNEVFFKILKKPSIVQKKMIPHIKGLDFSQR